MSLKDDILTDLDTFLDTDEFGVEVAYGSGIIKGIFDNVFIADQQGEVDVETLQPQVTVKTSDVSGIAQGDTMTIDSVDYNVIGIQPDGTGLTNILLSKD